MAFERKCIHERFDDKDVPPTCPALEASYISIIALVIWSFKDIAYTGMFTVSMPKNSSKEYLSSGDKSAECGSIVY